MPLNPKEVKEVQFLVVADDGSIYPFNNDHDLDDAIRNNLRPADGTWRLFKLTGAFNAKGNGAEYVNLEIPKPRTPRD